MEIKDLLGELSQRIRDSQHGYELMMLNVAQDALLKLTQPVDRPVLVALDTPQKYRMKHAAALIAEADTLTMLKSLVRQFAIPGNARQPDVTFKEMKDYKVTSYWAPRSQFKTEEEYQKVSALNPEGQPHVVSDKFYRRLAESFTQQLWPVYVAQIMDEGVGEFFGEDFHNGRLKFALDTFPDWLRRKVEETNATENR